MRQASTKSGCTVGSPPAYWRHEPEYGRTASAAFSILSSCSSDTSHTVPDALALAKQIGQRRLHRLVRSTLTMVAVDRCSSQSPQSRGHEAVLGVVGLSMPAGRS